MEQAVNINFAQGLNTKTDEWQLPIGQFHNLQNSIFQKGGLLQKRNGYGEVNNNSPNSSYITTLNGNLTAVGSTVSAYSQSLNEWITKGNLQPCSLSVLPLIRNGVNQFKADTAVANGMVCTAYTETDGTSTYKYAISDAITGQNILEPTLIPPLMGGAISGSSRVFIVGEYFVIVSQTLIGGSTFLQYISIPLSNPVNPATNISNSSLPQNVNSQSYVPTTSNPGWDGISVNSGSSGTLVIAYNTTSGGQSINVTTLNQQQIATNNSSTIIKSFAGFKAAIVSVCVDLTANPNVFYISFWNNSNSNVYTCAVTIGFGSITQKFAPVIIMNALVANIASAAQNSSCQVFCEIINAYSYDSAIPTNFIRSVAVSSVGVVGTPYVSIRSVGLASKAFIINGIIYYLSAYSSTFQPTYFLINGSLSTSANPIIVAKLAYENGGGYLPFGLPNVSVSGSTAQISYLFKDLVQALNTLNNPQQTTAGGIYSQTGINLVSFNVQTMQISSAEIANNLHISGGYLSQYDGYLPVEHNFFVWPDSVEVTTATGSGNLTAQTYFYQWIYQWTDNNGLPYYSAPSIPVSIVTTTANSTNTIHVPTLRLTGKTANPVVLVGYRWSTANQVYNQITSIVLPVVNDTTIDSITFVDTQADSSIIGNSLIYTTGGVVEDINAPSSNIMTLFDTRLWLVDAEDPNLLWVSKQVIEGTPVEMSDLFTIYVAPNIGTTGSTGSITALAPMDDKLIIFKKNAIYYINGIGPNILGQTAVGCSLGNYSQPIFVASVVGCTNQHSIVLTEDGLMFQSDKGIWLLTRNMQTIYVGAPVEDFNSFSVNSANVIPKTNYVLFTLNTGVMLMYDYYYKQWGTFTGLSAASSCIYQNLHTLIDKYGRILQETPGQYLDASNPVLISFTTSWLNIAGLQGYERLREFYILARFLSPHSLLCEVAYNYESSILHSKLITPKNYSSPIPSPFGVPTPFGSPRDKEQWRVHAKQQLCESFQVTITEVFNPIYGTIAGAGFTMSGLTCYIEIENNKRPMPGKISAGVG